MPIIRLAALALALAPTPFDGKVVAVADGDTLSVLRDGRTMVKVRLWGVDAPESGQDWGDKARRRLVELAASKAVRVEPVEIDRYGRTVARIRMDDGERLEVLMVRDGFAWWYAKYAPNDATLSRAEAEARKARRGLWSASVAPVAPWEWREGAALPSDVAGKFVASSRSSVYHLPGCKTVVRIAPANRITFDSAEAAMKSGRTRAKDCR